jgi:hypothetical protein
MCIYKKCSQRAFVYLLVWFWTMTNDVNDPTRWVQGLMNGQCNGIVVGMHGAVTGSTTLLLVGFYVGVFRRHLCDGCGLGATTKTEYWARYSLPLWKKRTKMYEVAISCKQNGYLWVHATLYSVDQVRSHSFHLMQSYSWNNILAHYYWCDKCFGIFYSWLTEKRRESFMSEFKLCTADKLTLEVHQVASMQSIEYQDSLVLII